MKAVWKGKILAQSDNTIVVEGNHYFPHNSVNEKFFKKNDFHTTCPWKGEASYYDIVVNGEVNENAAWYYKNPKEASEHIAGHVAFWNGVKIEE
ncbi:MAG: DUF427 domain-containing protein [Candidatus Paceibacterota bacterium]